MTQQGHANHLKNKAPAKNGVPEKRNKHQGDFIAKGKIKKPKTQPNPPKPNKAEKARNRSLLKYVRDGHTKKSRTHKEAIALYKSLRQHGLASSGVDAIVSNSGINRQEIHSDMQTHGSVAVAPAVTSFQASLIYPGYYDSPYIDESHICPCPHGVAHGSLNFLADNTTYAVVFVAPSLASGVSASLATQRSGVGVLPQGFPTTTITTDMVCGTAGSWVNVFGNTTASKKIFSWAGRVEVSLQIPEATVQGIVYVGNAPASMVIGATVADLIRLSIEAQGESGGATYTIRNSIVELGMAHAPYSTYSITDLPQDERVSWMMFSPASAGTISGAAPADYKINALYHANYFWVPTYQPQVVGSTEAQVKAESGVMIPPKDREAISAVCQRSSVSSTLSELLGKGAKIAAAGAGVARIVGLFWAGALPISAGLGIASSAMGMASGALAETEPTVSTISNAMDTDYVLTNIIPRWGSWDQYPKTITDCIREFESTTIKLKALFEKNEEFLVEYRDDWLAANNTIVTIEGKRQWTKKLASGRTTDDYRQLVGDRLRSPSLTGMSEFSSKASRR